MSDDVVTIELTARESTVIALAFTSAILSGGVPGEAIEDMRTVGTKMEAAIVAQKMTNWNEEVN